MAGVHDFDVGVGPSEEGVETDRLLSLCGDVKVKIAPGRACYLLMNEADNIVSQNPLEKGSLACGTP